MPHHDDVKVPYDPSVQPAHNEPGQSRFPVSEQGSRVAPHAGPGSERPGSGHHAGRPANKTGPRS